MGVAAGIGVVRAVSGALSGAAAASGDPSVIVPPGTLGLAHGAGHWSRPGSGELDISRHPLVIGWLYWTACPLRFPRVFLGVD
jgi:hypothetical protein